MNTQICIFDVARGIFITVSQFIGLIFTLPAAHNVENNRIWYCLTLGGRMSKIILLMRTITRIDGSDGIARAE
jgi:hypothetical protein